MAVTPNYSWPVPVATDYVKDGWEAISDLGNAIDTTVAGLGSDYTHLNTTTFTTQSAVIIDNVFSSTYQNYKILMNLNDVSATTGLLWYGRSGSPAADTTTSYYSQYIGAQNTSLYGSNNANSEIWAINASNENYCQFEFNVFSPNVAQITLINTFGMYLTDVGQLSIRTYATSQNSTTQFTGIKFLTGTGTISGTIRVYGLANS